MHQSLPPPSSKNFWIPFGGAFILWLSLLFYASGYLPKNTAVPGRNAAVTVQEFGQLGDTFGMLNTLFTAVAMCAAFYTLRVQGWQIQDQKYQLANEKSEKEIELKREKLEKLVASLIELSDLMAELVDEKIEMPTIASIHLFCSDRQRRILKPISGAEALVKLYFSQHLPRLVPKRSCDDCCQALYGIKSTGWSNIQDELSNFRYHCTMALKEIEECTVFAVEQSKVIIGEKSA